MSDSLESLLAKAQEGKGAALYLFVGDEFLVRQGADELIKALLPDMAAGFNYAVMDGGSPREVAGELAMLPMFPGRKVVYLRDPEFLAPKKGRTDGLSKAREAWKANRRKEGARRLLALVARVGWSARELDPTSPNVPGLDKWKELLDLELAEADVAFLKEVAEFCSAEGLSAPEGDDSVLVAAFEKGLPPGHTLVVAATDVDVKHPLYKWAKDKGALLERKVASKLKELDVTELAQRTLAPHQKRLSPDAEKELKNRVGGNTRLLQSELEKLALYVDKPVIQQEDVELLVHHSREDEFMELSDAIAKRDLPAALAYVNDGIAQGQAPLALLGGITSIVRSLLQSFERMTQLTQGKPPRNFNDFKASVFPKIEAEARAQKGKVPHPYAAFMSMQSAASFQRRELLDALRLCAEADLALKRGGNELLIERLLWTLCARMPPGRMSAA